MTTESATASVGRGRVLWLACLAIAAGLAAVLGAYIDWMWWLDYTGIILTVAAIGILVIGGVLALLGRGLLRRGGLIAVAIGVGLIVGQNLGPSREPLIVTQGGTMTLRLTSPEDAEATTPVTCSNVASATEFQVSGNPIVDLGQQDRVVDSVYLNVGDRWEAIEDAPRRNGVRLDISITDRKIPDAGGPLMVVMGATDASTVESTFTNEGGRVRFAGLAPQLVEGLASGQPIDLAGTIEWTCGRVVLE